MIWRTAKFTDVRRRQRTVPSLPTGPACSLARSDAGATAYPAMVTPSRMLNRMAREMFASALGGGLGREVRSDPQLTGDPKGALEIGLEVGDVLEPDADPKQAGTDSTFEELWLG